MPNFFLDPVPGAPVDATCPACKRPATHRHCENTACTWLLCSDLTCAAVWESGSTPTTPPRTFYRRVDLGSRGIT